MGVGAALRLTRGSSFSSGLRPISTTLGGSPWDGVSAVARKKTPKVRVNVKASLSRRLKAIRQEQFGEHGGPELSRRLSLPARTWDNYETAVTDPAEVLLRFSQPPGVYPLSHLSCRV